MVTGIMSESDRRMDAINRGLLRAVAVIAGVVSVIAAWSLVVNSVRILAAARVTVADMPLADDSAPGIARDWTAITEAHYDSVTIVASGLSSPARWWLVAEHLGAALPTIGIALLVLWIRLRLVRRRPFVRSVTVGIAIAAILIMAGGALQQLAHGIARAEVVMSLGEPTITGGPSLAEFFVTVDGAPFAWGIALAVVGAAFEIGERLQRDTDGLV
jgi:hypothetical protein